MAAEQGHIGMLVFTRRERLRRLKETERLVERSGLKACPCGGQRPLGTSRWVPGQLNGSSQERRRCGHSASGLRAAGGPLELERDSFVGTGGGRGEMPGPAVGIEVRVRDLCECAVDESPVDERRVLVDDGSDHRVSEPQVPALIEQSGHRRGRVRVGRDAQAIGGRSDQDGIADLIRGDHEEQASRVVRERGHPTPEALLDLRGDGGTVRQPEAAGQRGGRPGTRQLQQRQGVAVRLGDDPLADRQVERAGHRGGKEVAGVRVPQRPDQDLR